MASVRQLVMIRILLIILLVINSISMAVLYNLSDYDLTYIYIHLVIYIILCVAITVVTLKVRQKIVEELQHRNVVITVGGNRPPQSVPGAQGPGLAQSQATAPPPPGFISNASSAPPAYGVWSTAASSGPPPYSSTSPASSQSQNQAQGGYWNPAGSDAAAK